MDLLLLFFLVGYLFMAIMIGFLWDLALSVVNPNNTYFGFYIPRSFMIIFLALIWPISLPINLVYGVCYAIYLSLKDTSLIDDWHEFIDRNFRK